MHNKRPRFLNLWQIRLPVAGLVSIFHRVSGVFIYLMLPVLLYLLELSLSSPAGYARVEAIMTSWPVRLVGCVLIMLFAHHLMAGVRELLIDLGWGDSLAAARRSAWLVLCGTALVLMTGALL